MTRLGNGLTRTARRLALGVAATAAAAVLVAPLALATPESDAASMVLPCWTSASIASLISRAWVVLSKSKTAILPLPADVEIVSVSFWYVVVVQPAASSAGTSFPALADALDWPSAAGFGLVAPHAARANVITIAGTASSLMSPDRTGPLGDVREKICRT